MVPVEATSYVLIGLAPDDPTFVIQGSFGSRDVARGW